MSQIERKPILRDLLIAFVAAILALAGSYLLEPIKFNYEVKKRLYEEKLQLYFDLNEFLKYEATRKITKKERDIDDLIKEAISLSVRADLLFENKVKSGFKVFSERIFMEGSPVKGKELEYSESISEEIRNIRESLKKELNID